MTDALPDEPRVTLVALLQRRRIDGQSVHFEVSDDWLQGRTTFGGLISVMGLQAMRDVAGAAWPAEVSLRALQTNFIGPVEQGPVQVEVHTLRDGRNVRQVMSTVKQHGVIAALIVGVFGVDRETSLPLHVPFQPPVARPPHETPRTVPLIGAMPNFVRHIDMRWAEGSPPASGADEWDARIHLRMTDEDAARLDGELAIVLMADASPSPALSRLTQRGPASSISWALELHPLAKEENVAGWWRTDNHVEAARGGYINVQATLWTPGGNLAALGYQVVAVYG